MPRALKKSPDDMDAVNLAYYEYPGLVVLQNPNYQSASERLGLLGQGSPEAYARRSNAERRGLYGRH
jgi:hypothetical protein